MDSTSKYGTERMRTVAKVSASNGKVHNGRVFFLDEVILSEAFVVHDDVRRQSCAPKPF